LAWAQHQSNIATHYDWNRWIWLSVVANLLLPLGILWMFFGQGIVYLDWLKNQRSNAWNYGWAFGNWRHHLKWAGAMTGVMLIVMIIFRFMPAGREAAYYYKTAYFPPVNGFADMAKLLATLVVYMFCWEFFFRGFLLFGMAQGFGPIIAIIAQAAIFGATHFGKPPAEMIGAFAGGLILGALCWKEKSFVPAFYTHALIHVAWAILVFL
jgi:membrane protease YdiL (CAAX protease family)